MRENDLHVPTLGQVSDSSDRFRCPCRISVNAAQLPTIVFPCRDLVRPVKKSDVMTRVARQVDRFALSCAREDVDVSWQVAWGVNDVEAPVTEKVDGVGEDLVERLPGR